MPDRLGHLPLAIRHVVEGESRIAKLEATILAMVSKGQDVRRLRQSLRVMQETLRHMRDHVRYLESE
jgi:hypothetical protein